jgi:hypothetical protein
VRASAEALASMSDSDCRRFLRARNHDVEKAADMARNALDWSLFGARGVSRSGLRALRALQSPQRASFATMRALPVTGL